MASLNDSWGVFDFIGKKLEIIKTLIENNYIHYGMPPCMVTAKDSDYQWL